MKVKDLVNFAQKNPALMEEEISIVLKPDSQYGGPLDGAVAVHFNSVQTAMFGTGGGILLWANPQVTMSDVYNPNRMNLIPKLVFFGPVPDCLKPAV
jgi:hypothetical protein